MAFAMEPKAKGDEDKVFTALRRLQEEDPTIDLHRDAQTGEQIVAGLSQIHVEVIVDRHEVALRRRGRRSSRRACPTRRRSAARQGPRPPQEADRRARPVRRLPHRDRAAARRRRLRVRQRDQGRRDPDGFIPAVEKGVRRGDGSRARSPATRSRACACGSSTAQLPHGRLLGDGVQDGRLDRDEAGARAGRRRCCSSRSCSSTLLGARGDRRRRHRRPQLAPRAPAGHGGRPAA